MKIQKVLYLLIAVLVLVVLFYVMRPHPTSPVSSTQKSLPSNTKTTEKITPSPIKLVIKNKKLVSGNNTITVKQGDAVTLQITCDENEEFHLHGYDKMVDLEKDKPATLSFIADTTGRFPFELEKSGTELGALEVQPK